MTMEATIDYAVAKQIYSSQELSLLDPFHIPSHVAIIMDGNRRWAKKHNLPVLVGHWEGAEALTSVVKGAIALGIKVLTVYSFSTENWARSSQEVRDLIHLLEVYLIKKRKFMQREKVRLDAIGNLSKFPSKIRKIFYETKEATRKCDKIDLILALNYGGRDEITRAISKIIDDYDQKKLSKRDISEALFANYLDTSKWKDPELLIRTSGESRLSNFLLWQISYSEVCVTDVLWPDFSEKHLFGAVLEYQKRKRRFGGS